MQALDISSWLTATFLTLAISMLGFLTPDSGRLTKQDIRQVTRELKTMSTGMDKANLEEIRRVAIQYYETEKPEFWHAFVQELQRGAIFLDRSPPAIGIWKFQPENNKAVLIRQPPPSPEMLYFGLNLTKQDNKWTVTSDFLERERLDIHE
jgi:hypothetical protein